MINYIYIYSLGALFEVNLFKFIWFKINKNQTFFLFFYSKIILGLLLFIISLYLLNINKIFYTKDFINLIINLIYSNFTNILFFRINILFVYIIIISNKSFLFQVINKYKSNINVFIESLFL